MELFLGMIEVGLNTKYIFEDDPGHLRYIFFEGWDDPL